MSSADGGELSRVHLRITGQVQGVSFRWYGRRRAQSLGLAGWIRNCPDGSVEALVQGPAPAVEDFVEWARRGPSAAHVQNVDTQAERPDPALRDFRVVG